MKPILFVFPTAWDLRQLEACRVRWRDRFTVELGDPSDEDCAEDFDVLGYVQKLVDGRRADLAGVTSSSDYPGAVVAAAVATGLGLAGARPESILACSHKLESRAIQRAAASEAVPAFAPVDPTQPGEPLRWSAPPAREYPCFLKPAKGAFSVHSGAVSGPQQLVEFVTRSGVHDYREHYLRLFHRLAQHFAPWMPDSRLFLAEELLGGHQVTVEGFVLGGKVEILGIVDSVMHPGTRSFARFEYPSALPEAVQARMVDVVRRVVLASGLDRTLFNVELIYDPDADRVWIVEINPRMCGQFADLYEKVDGTNGYEVALQLAAGETPRLDRRAGRFRVAASYPLRVFEPMELLRAPDPADIRAAEALYPETLVWVECSQGDRLCDFENGEDGWSARYAIVNLGAPDRNALHTRAAAIESRLGFHFAPCQKAIAAVRQGGAHGRDVAEAGR